MKARILVRKIRKARSMLLMVDACSEVSRGSHYVTVSLLDHNLMVRRS